ncbi:MAG: hypothetical protein JW936_03475 [Sedimentisphaerales bacterium]|nr:hypothetical protein [Sedimentisphaerales bacterium]
MIRFRPVLAALIVISALIFSHAAAQQQLTVRDRIGIAGPSDSSQRLWQRFAELGFRHFRIVGNFCESAAAPDQIDFTTYDNWAQLCRRYQLEPLIVLGYGHNQSWATTAPASVSGWQKTSYPPDLLHFTQWARQLAARHPQIFRQFEVWTETNHPNLSWAGSYAQYAEMLHACYRAVKSANPRALCAMAGTDGVDFGFMRSITQSAPAADCTDALVAHPYGIPPRLWTPEFPAACAEMVRLADSLSPRRQVWFTEFGLAYEPANDQDRGQELAKHAILSMALGIDRDYLFAFDNDPDYAIVNRDENFTPRPAFFALQEMMQNIGPMICLGRIETEYPLVAVLFALPDRSAGVIAAWSEAEPASWTIPLTGQSQNHPQVQLTRTITYLPIANPAAINTLPTRSLPRIDASAAVPGFIEAPAAPIAVVCDQPYQRFSVRARIHNNTDQAAIGSLWIAAPEGFSVQPDIAAANLASYQASWATFELVANRPLAQADYQAIKIYGAINDQSLQPRELAFEFLDDIGLTTEVLPARFDVSRQTLVLPVRVIAQPHMDAGTVVLRPAATAGITWINDSVQASLAPGQTVTFDLPFQLAPNVPAQSLIFSAIVATPSSTAQISTTIDMPFALPAEITVDGQIADWPDTGVLRIGRPEQFDISQSQTWQGPDDLSARVRLAYDVYNLYILAEVTDDHILDNHLPIAEAWNAECLEIFLSMANRQNLPGNVVPPANGDYRIVIPISATARADGQTWAHVYRPGANPSSQYVSEFGPLRDLHVAIAATTTNSYVVEIAIPWPTLRPFDPAPGTTFGFDFAIDDADIAVRQNQAAWHSRQFDIYSNLAQWGTIMILPERP